jgi:hypothetical protein
MLLLACGGWLFKIIFYFLFWVDDNYLLIFGFELQLSVPVMFIVLFKPLAYL